MNDEEILEEIPRNIGLDLVRVTEAAAQAAGRWIGSGQREVAHRAAVQAMHACLQQVAINGHVVIGEESHLKDEILLDSGQQVGTGQGPAVDVALDPIDGTSLLIRGHPGAISLIAITDAGAMLPTNPAVYMEKIIVDATVAKALVPECMDAPAGWTLALVARVKRKPVRDLTVLVLERPRHDHLIAEIREAGARVLLRDDGDATGALEVATRKGADILMGIGGAPEGVIAACAVKALGGGMLARFAPQNQAEQAAVLAAGLNPKQVLTLDDLVKGNRIFFAATGVTDSTLLSSVRYHGQMVETHSLLLRSETRTRRFIHTEYRANDS